MAIHDIFDDGRFAFDGGFCAATRACRRISMPARPMSALAFRKEVQMHGIKRLRGHRRKEMANKQGIVPFALLAQRHVNGCRGAIWPALMRGGGFMGMDGYLKRIFKRDRASWPKRFGNNPWHGDRHIDAPDFSMILL